MDTSSRIGPYRILRALPGGSAETELFLAVREDDARETPVCLKRVHPNYAEDPGFSQRFEVELSIARRLRHRNVVEVEDFGEDGGFYFVMEYIDGPSLEALLRGGRLTPSVVAYLGIELCRAFVYLHHSDPAEGRGPLIHGDIAPRNVLLDRHTGGVKLADFGLAKVLGYTDAETLLTRAGGEPTFLSPEQLRDEKVSARTDLFSLGLVLWTALVGTHPYVEGRPQTVPPTPLAKWLRAQTLANDRRSVAEAAPHAPVALCQAIEGLLQPLPERWHWAEEVYRVLGQTDPPDGHAQLMAWIAEVDA